MSRENSRREWPEASRRCDKCLSTSQHHEPASRKGAGSDHFQYLRNVFPPDPLRSFDSPWGKSKGGPADGGALNFTLRKNRRTKPLVFACEIRVAPRGIVHRRSIILRKKPLPARPNDFGRSGWFAPCPPGEDPPPAEKVCSVNGIRTRVPAVKGRCPRPG